MSIFRKQSWLWAQGDLYRAQNKPLQPINTPILAVDPHQHHRQPHVTFNIENNKIDASLNNSLNEDDNDDEQSTHRIKYGHEESNIIINDENYETVLAAEKRIGSSSNGAVTRTRTTKQPTSNVVSKNSISIQPNVYKTSAVIESINSNEVVYYSFNRV